MSHVGPVESFPANGSKGVVVDGRSLLVVRRQNDVYVYSNSCPHTRETLDPTGGSVLSSDGLLLRCERHGAEFVTETGECVGGPCLMETLEPVPFTLSGGEIYLD